jgi:hypothetical protein
LVGEKSLLHASDDDTRGCHPFLEGVIRADSAFPSSSNGGNVKYSLSNIEGILVDREKFLLHAGNTDTSGCHPLLEGIVWLPRTFPSSSSIRHEQHCICCLRSHPEHQSHLVNFDHFKRVSFRALCMPTSMFPR